NILDDECSESCAVQRSKICLRCIEFPREDERVERHVALDPVAMAECDDFRQFLLREIVRTQPCIESRESEVDRVRAIRDRRTQTFPIPRRGEKFGSFAERWKTISHRGSATSDTSSITPAVDSL